MTAKKIALIIYNNSVLKTAKDVAKWCKLHPKELTEYNQLISKTPHISARKILDNCELHHILMGVSR